jgi:hypothetical protein
MDEKHMILLLVCVLKGRESWTSCGSLTGVIDWAETEILPFGLNLWGLENILCYMDAHGWHYLDRHTELRALFWDTFHGAVADDGTVLQKQGAIDLARRMGILFRYGFACSDKMQREVAQDDSSRMRYLDALFTDQR